MIRPATKHCHLIVSRGFTLIELLLVMAIIAVLSVATIPVYLDFVVRNNLDIAATTCVQSFRRAQSLSRVKEAGSVWGVKIETGDVIVFKGSSYSLRDVDFDEKNEIAPNIFSAGLSEVVFESGTGRPISPGSVTISVGGTAEQRVVSINEKGIVSF